MKFASLLGSLGFIICGVALAMGNPQAQQSAGTALACIGLIRCLLYLTTKNEN